MKSSKRTMSRKKLTPHQKIIQAAHNGRGTNLTAEDCFQLSIDTAIWDAATDDANALEENYRPWHPTDE